MAEDCVASNSVATSFYLFLNHYHVGIYERVATKMNVKAVNLSLKACVLTLAPQCKVNGRHHAPHCSGTERGTL